MSSGEPPGADGAAGTTRPRRALLLGALLVLAVVAAGAWLILPRGTPATDERVVALPDRPAPPPPAPPPSSAAPALPPAAPAASPPAAGPRADGVASFFPASLGTLDGFGSARFDMTEQEVRAAIDRDFPPAASGRRRVGQIDQETDRVFLTRALLASVRDVLPGTGPAHVEYVLGYQRQRLIQVNVIWGAFATPPTPRADTQALSAQLQDFVARAYGPNLRTTLAQPDGSVVDFVGRDRQGRLVELASSLQSPQRYWVRISYVQDPLTGDVYRLPRGAF